MLGPFGFFSERGEKITSLSKYRNEKISKQRKNEFAGMSKGNIEEKIKTDTAKFLADGGKIKQIPEGYGTLEIAFQDKT